jgi:hypothetical protein
MQKKVHKNRWMGFWDASLELRICVGIYACSRVFAWILLLAPGQYINCGFLKFSNGNLS